MKSILRLAGLTIWWCSWPVMWLYLRGSKRTRLVLRNERGQVLMVRGWIASGHKWSLPGGGLHRGEEPLRGVVREVREEVGIRLRPDSLMELGNFPIKSKGFRFNLYFFAVTMVNTPELRLQWYEIAEARWMDRASLTPINTEPDVLRALALLAPHG